ncbi:hypothetical protein QJS10_CPA09g01101 [Acorus calamus]|uniref:Uncharacterized protein n=1 Tax=Acorus calamus TaxID=4465 RepID=A0AAV9E4I5_ACOCL|nr:hypothetical protein QJS10_CPA09g01101 [Acorus calamus]
MEYFLRMLKAGLPYLLVNLFVVNISDIWTFSIVATNIAIAFLSSIPEETHWPTVLTLSAAGCIGLLGEEDRTRHVPLLVCAVVSLMVSIVGLIMSSQSPSDTHGFIKWLGRGVFAIAYITIALVAY